MTGFVVRYGRSSAQAFDVADNRDRTKLVLSPHARHFRGKDGGIVLIDGYVLGTTAERLATALEAQDDQYLARLHGHYCALVITSDGELWGHCDRFGARTLYWCIDNEGDVVICSRWETLPPIDYRWDDLGLAEMLRYRWSTGTWTVFEGVSQLPLWHRVRFLPGGRFSLTQAAQKPDLPDRFIETPLEEHVDATRRVLKETVSEIASSHGKIAVLLSGGVDSSLLAAFCKSGCSDTLLVTPVFSGNRNPELGRAQAFARALKLPHLLVNIEEDRLEAHLVELVGAKGNQVKFHLLAMRQMFEAIPEDYQVVLYGSGADTLFGSAAYKRARTLLRRKRVLDVFPRHTARLLSRVPSRKARNLSSLADVSSRDIALEHFQVPYSPEEMAVVRQLSSTDLDSIIGHRLFNQYLARRDRPLFRVLQEIAMTTDWMNSYREIELLAMRFNKFICSPYLDARVIDVAAKLSPQQYFGKSDVKPVLRQLAREYYGSGLIDVPKLGFEIPFLDWLSGPLAPFVDQVRQERDLFDGSVLRTFDVQKHYPLFWTLINWRLIGSSMERSGGSVGHVPGVSVHFGA